VLLSMTGYGSGRAPLGEGRLVVEVRAVNHRYLDVRCRLPSELGDVASAAEEVVRELLDRGRVEVTGRREGEAVPAPRLDRARAKAAYADLCALRDELRPDEPVPLTLLAGVPDLFTTPGGPPEEDTREAVRRASRAACEALAEMRAREGAALATDLHDRCDRIRAHVDAVATRAPEIVDAYRRKLTERIDRLLADGRVELDGGRLEHEVVLFADRGDITEELTRLGSHCDQVKELMAAEGRAKGRRLDFLLQEMNRETNTIGAKSSDAEISRIVVEVKAELERMREQVQNVL